MGTVKKLPPEDVIREDSEPSVTEIKEPKKKPDEEGVDIDDAQIEEPKDDAFRKSPQPAPPSKQRRQKA
jgi:hypothetical protein